MDESGHFPIKISTF